jgi:RluA family pseudouridine synthase
VRLVYVDDDVVVVDKPAGLLSAPTAGAERREPDLLGVLRARLARGGRAGRGARLWLVHRLDREASGLLVLARSARAFAWLKDDLRARRIERRYLAVVHGELGAAGAARAQARVQSFVRDAGARVQSVSTAEFRGATPGPRTSAREADARFASTRYQRLAAGRGCSLVEVALDTGRKHQIRVHLAGLGHPIVGDARYGGRKPRSRERLHLHAARLEFQHPGSGRWMEFHSPAPPEFWRRVGSAPPGAEGAPVPGAEGAPAPGGAPARASESAAPGGSGAAEPTAAAIDSSWEPVADWYDELLDERRNDHYRDLILPGALRLLEAAPGSRVLDLACGQGALARQLAERGVEVVGVDLSPRLIELARRRARGLSPRPRFAVGDARALDALDLGEFDAVACVMGLANLEPMEDAIASAARRLRPGGALVAVLPHPAFRAPRQTSWVWESDAQGRPQQYRRVDGYLSPAQVRIVANPGAVAHGRPAVETWTFHRPLQSYVRALAAHGLWIDRLEEWPSQRTSQAGPRAAEENRARGEIPLFLGLRARKVAAGGERAI